MNNNISSVWNPKEMNRHRRQSVLSKYKGDKFMAGQVLLRHCKESRNPEVKAKARADALYFFSLANSKAK